MICRCEVLWGAVGPHRAGEKIDLSEEDADRLYKIGAVRMLYKHDTPAPNAAPETPVSATKPAPKAATPQRRGGRPAKK